MNNISNTKSLLTYISDDFIEQLHNGGYIFFSFTINYDSYGIDEKTNELNFKLWEAETLKLFWTVQTNFLTWSGTIVSAEKSDNNLLHSHGIIILKNLTGYPKNIELNIKQFFKKNLSYDVKINNLPSFIDIKRFFMYIYKNKDTGFFLNSVNYNINEQDLYADLVDFLEGEDWFYEIFNKTILDHDRTYITQNKASKLYFDKFKKINGIVFNHKKNLKEISIDFIFNLFTFYILANDIVFYNDKYFIKKKNTLITYELWCVKNKLLEKYDEIVQFFINYNSNYVNNFDFFDLRRSNVVWNNLDSKLQNIDKTVNIKINIDYTLIEFKDGVFNLKTNVFYNKKNLNVSSVFIHKGTLKHTKNTYKYKKIPKLWLTTISKALQYNVSEIVEFLSYLGMIFSTNYEEMKKKRVLFIFGESNTFKTTIIAELFINFYGQENVAFLTQSKNFPFQNFENKMIAVLDEFKYYDTLHTEYLKLFENREIIIDKKFKDAIVVNPLNIVIISNEDFIQNQNDVDKQKALQNRIKTFTFHKNFLKNLDDQLKEKFSEENLDIVIFVSKFYHEIYGAKKDKRKKQLLKDLIEHCQSNQSKQIGEPNKENEN